MFVFDADQNNRQVLMAANPAYEPAFTPDYKQVLTFAPQKDKPDQERLSRTWMLNAADR
jgi:hypothetical protein